MRILDLFSVDFGTSWLPVADAIVKATLLFACRRPRVVCPSPRIGRAAPHDLDARAGERRSCCQCSRSHCPVGNGIW